ncbi:MAG TPA: RNA polymerase subunit sigma-70 [Gaiellaceae bacterium]|nr:RNA polymerase subunit sigma-70 [Gaiellaceae bacterium]
MATGEAELLAAARGDEEAFRLLVEPHRDTVHLHCYRMLGSVHDADDALQETLLRAWRFLDRFEPGGRFGAWLHAIATNVCLTALAGRRRRPEVPVAETGEDAWNERLLHLSPYPDRLLDAVETREAVELAFVTAAQLLPPKQRAVLILRDVLDWSAKETAEVLGDSVAAVNSALQRARAGLERARSLGAPSHRPARAADEHALLGRFMAAWDAVDVDGIVSLLARDAMMAMPPEPFYVRGAAAVGEFFATVPLGGRLDEIRLVPTAANRQPALAAYVADPDRGGHAAYGIMVFALAGDAVAGIVGFADPSNFERFGLPSRLEG